jgi:hypothetical protein
MARQQLARAPVLLQSNQVAVKAIETLIALDQKLFDDLVHFAGQLAPIAVGLARIHQMSSGGSDKTDARRLFHRRSHGFL